MSNAKGLLAQLDQLIHTPAQFNDRVVTTTLLVMIRKALAEQVERAERAESMHIDEDSWRGDACRALLGISSDQPSPLDADAQKQQTPADPSGPTG